MFHFPSAFQARRGGMSYKALWDKVLRGTGPDGEGGGAVESGNLWKPVEHVTEQCTARSCHVATDPLRESLLRNKDDVFERDTGAVEVNGPRQDCARSESRYAMAHCSRRSLVILRISLTFCSFGRPFFGLAGFLGQPPSKLIAPR